MKIRLLLSISAIALLTSNLAFAQCTIDTSPLSQGAHPNPLPTACVGVSYSQDITLVFPVDTTVFGFTVPIDSVIVTGFTNEPAGLSLVCGVANCTAYGTPGADFRMCLSISGTPSAIQAMDSIGVNFTAYATIFGSPQAFDSYYITNIAVDEADASVTQVSNVLTADASGVSYQWLDCDNANAPIPGETNQVFTATATGNYALVVTSGGCVDSSACFAVTVAGLSSNSSAGQMIAFPNPSTGSLTIDLGAEYGNVSAVVRTIDGKQISSQEFYAAKSISLNIEGEKGYYFVEISSAEGTQSVLKILKN